jgi:hypothetical protein
MSWIEDAWDYITDTDKLGSGDLKGSSILDVLAALGIMESGFDDMEVPKVGYQGKIPEYQVVRERVPTSDEERRPGEAGRRYFSDMIYAQKPKSETPTVEQAQGQLRQQAAQLAQQEAMRRAQQTNQIVANMAAGGLASLPPKGYYLGVVPADVVSHLGNGNSSAGAKQLYDMMDRIRKARTGTEQQGKQVNPTKYTPA